MKRNIFLFAALLIAAVAVEAAPITSRQAAEKARTFLGLDMKHGTQAPLMMAMPDNGIQPYYVFNIGNNEGFVIVSGDDAACPILGYSDRGRLDVNNMPDNMKAWFEGYARDIKAMQKMNLPERPEAKVASDARKPIAELTKSKWDQMYPYNDQCFMLDIDKMHRPTGCVATAMAQVMYYHKWPVAETVRIPEYTFELKKGTVTVPALEPAVFDWDLMLDVYNDKSNFKSDQAVAKLMNYVGRSIKTIYSVDASAAYSEDIPEALIKYFGYKNTARLVYRQNYKTQEEWDDVMYKELEAGRPILYGGVTKDGSGHEFVCDGYDKDGFFHINWGWSGNSNGFFKLSILNPSEQGTGGAGDGMSFSEEQKAVIGIERPAETDHLLINGVTAQPGAEANVGIGLSLVGSNYTSLQFDVALPAGIEISSDANGAMAASFDKARSQKGDHKVSLNKLSDGKYRFVVTSPSNSLLTAGEGALINFNVKIAAGMSGGKYSALADNVMLCTSDMFGVKIDGCKFDFEISGKAYARGDVNHDDKIDEADVEAIVNAISGTAAGQCDKALADMNGDVVIDIADVMLLNDNILENKGSERHIVATDIDKNDALLLSSSENKLAVSLNNSTGYKAMQFDIAFSDDAAVTENIANSSRIGGFKIVGQKNGGRYTYLVYAEDNRNISLGEGVILEIALNSIVKNAKVSKITMVTSDLKKVLLGEVEFNETSGIGDIMLGEAGGDAIYTLEGIRVNAPKSSLKKGMYIINGKKVLVR